MDFQTLDIMQDLYNKDELSIEDYYAIKYLCKVSMEDLEQKYDYKPLRQLRTLPVDPKESE